jgi:hypothetical protein
MDMKNCSNCEHEDVLYSCEPCKSCGPYANWEPLEGIHKQVGGSHYQLAIEPIDYIVKNELGYREGNVVKYVTRHKKKNGAEDIKKAIHYLEMILEDYNGE